MTPWRNIPLDRRTSLTNLAIAASVALLIWLAWWFWKDAPPAPARQRQISDLLVTWQCDQGHRFEYRGACQTRSCAVCGAEAQVVYRYRCSEHGQIEARLRHGRNAAGECVLTGISLVAAEWITPPQAPTCPQCDRVLQVVGEDLFPEVQKRDMGAFLEGVRSIDLRLPKMRTRQQREIDRILEEK